jgi:RNA polymerase sigma-70 factor (TIGR02960 family)
VVDLLTRARAGDGDAFGQLVEPFRRELLVHCYRTLGSMQDAEDALQDTLLSAWQGMAGYEGRASLRTWLYRIATNRCLDARRSASRRPTVATPAPELHPPEPTRLGEVLWLQPYPDMLLDDAAASPEARYETRESISLAFVTALQLLPPRQRAVLLLRDVLGFHAHEAAHILGVTEESVTSALKRARATLQRQRPGEDAPPAPHSAAEQDLVARFTEAFESADVDGVVALFTDDAWLTMPPLPLEYQGRDLARRFLAATAFQPGNACRLVPTRANGQPAFGFYVRAPQTDDFHAIGLLVLTLSGSRVSASTCFESSVLVHFDLPLTVR